MMRYATLILFLLPMMAGCTTKEPVEWSIAAPQVGAHYTYEGNDGSRLEVEYVGVERFPDPWLRQTDSHILEWNFTSYRGKEFTFREAIDGNGRIVGQVAECGHIQPENGLSGPWTCRNPRGPSLYKYGAHGLAGAFGAGMAWNQSLRDGHRLSATEDILDLGPTHVSYDAQAQDGCLRFHTDDQNPVMPRALSLTVFGGDFTMCPDAALPTHFEAMMPFVVLTRTDFEGPLRYTLVDHEPGEGHRAAQTSRAPNVRLAATGTPAYTGIYTPVQLPLHKAHEVAMEEDPQYARIMEDGVLTGYYHSRQGYTRVPQNGAVSEQDYSKVFLIAADDTESRRVEITMTRSTTLTVASNDSYDVKGETVEAHMPDVTAQVGMEDLFGYAEQLHGYDLLSEWLGFTHARWPSTDFWGPFGDAYVETNRSHYSLWAFFADPHQEGEALQEPFNLVVDGRTGGIIAADVRGNFGG